MNYVRYTHYLLLSGILALLPVIGVPPILSTAPAGTTITVTTTSDAVTADDACSLREAIIAANTDSAFSDCPAGSGPDTILFAAELPLPAIFSLTNIGANEDSAATGDLDIAGTLTVEGMGADGTTIDGNGADRVLQILPGARVTIHGVMIRNGNPGSGVDGGGVIVDATGRLTVTMSTVINNKAARGGGVRVNGLLTMNGSRVEGNQGGGICNDGGLLTLSNVEVLNNSGGYGIENLDSGWLTFSGGSVRGNQGGGIYNSASVAELSGLNVVSNTAGGGVHSVGATSTRLMVSNSTIMSNTAVSGGGVLNDGIGAVASINNTRISYNVASAGGGGVNNNGTLTLVGSTIDQNRARSGGGIDHVGLSLEVTNATLSGNTSADNGGGLHNRATARLTNVTLHGNSASGVASGGNIFNDGGGAQVVAVNTIVASAGDGGNCANSEGVITSLGHNLENGETCSFDAEGDVTGSDPLVGRLAENGGGTPTHALLAGSPAIDAGGDDACPDTDQRGVARPQGRSCDIGSYELVLDSRADLSVEKTDGADPVSVGETLVYSITVGNAGPDPALGIHLTDTLPGGVVFTSAIPSQGSCRATGQTVICSLGDFDAGARTHIIIRLRAAAPGTLTNRVAASSTTPDPNRGDNEDTEQSTVRAALPHHIHLPIIQRHADLPVGDARRSHPPLAFPGLGSGRLAAHDMADGPIEEADSSGYRDSVALSPSAAGLDWGVHTVHATVGRSGKEEQ